MTLIQYSINTSHSNSNLNDGSSSGGPSGGMHHATTGGEDNEQNDRDIYDLQPYRRNTQKHSNFDKLLQNGPAEPSSGPIIVLNISGLRFQTTSETLERFPDTLLGSAVRRERFYRADLNEYFFERHRPSFDAILYWYQSGGYLKRPNNVPPAVFEREIKFFELGSEVLECFWEREGATKPPEVPLPTGKVKRVLWQFVEHPDSSTFARIFAIFSIFVIILSTTSFCLETLPELNVPTRCHLNSPKQQTAVQSVNETDTLRTSTTVDPTSSVKPLSPLIIAAISDPLSCNSWDSPFFMVEAVCIFWFTIEFIVRFYCCPSKRQFIRSFLNWVDFVAIVPFYISFILTEGGFATSFAILRIFRLVRVFRIFKLSRHSKGLQVLGKTIQASIQELCLLCFFLLITLILSGSAIYYSEFSVPDTKFTSIPASFWFGIGYGDMFPVTPLGKFVGGICAIVGVLVLALPVTVIVSNFKRFYEQEVQVAHLRQDDDVHEGDHAADEAPSTKLASGATEDADVEQPLTITINHASKASPSTEV